MEIAFRIPTTALQHLMWSAELEASLGTDSYSQTSPALL